MPSFVAFQQQGGMLVGDDAKGLRTLPQDRVIFDSKRLIGRRFADIDEEELRLLPYSVVEGKSGGVAIALPEKDKKRNVTPEEVASFILSKLKRQAEQYLNRPVDSAVITVPAYFSDSQRESTRRAGLIAAKGAAHHQRADGGLHCVWPPHWRRQQGAQRPSL